MKKLTFLAGTVIVMGLSAFLNRASGQISITYTDLPYAGLTVVTEKDSTTPLLPGPPSSSAQYWDFSTMQRQKAATTVFMLPGATPYSSTFAAANLADSTYGGNGYSFFDTNTASFAAEGAEEFESAGGYNFQIEINLSPEFLQANLPATYNSVIPLSYATGSETFAVTLSVIVTGEKFNTTIEYSDTVDAFGTMLMPNGSTYNVLRQKHNEIDIDSVFLMTTFGGGAWTYYERILTYKNQYDWYTNGAGYILVEMDMDTTSSTVKDVIWDTTAPQPVVSTAPTVGFNLTDISCNGSSNGTATANVSGGVSPYTYLWEPGGITTSTVSGLNAGTYTLSVTGNNDSTTIENFTITQPSTITLTADSVNVTGVCNGSASIAGSGGTGPYTYSWTTSGQTTDTITNQCVGNYCCVVTDANGCTSSICVNIDLSTGIDEAGVKNDEIRVFPNPNNGNFNMELSGTSGQSSVEIYNIFGQRIIKEELLNKSNEINLSSNAAGVYFYRVIKEDGSLLGEGKIVIEK